MTLTCKLATLSSSPVLDTSKPLYDQCTLLATFHLLKKKNLEASIALALKKI